MVGESPYRKNQNPIHLNGKEDHRNRFEPLATSDILKWVIKYGKWWGAGNTPSSRGDPSKISGIKRCTTFYDLP
jgi:hypothetical protein